MVGSSRGRAQNKFLSVSKSETCYRRSVFTVANRLAAGLLLLLSLTAGWVKAQPSPPTVNFQKTADGSNLLFQLATESNWFYTFQQSTSLTNWGYATDYFTSNTSLSWTNPIASNNTARFFRVSVNAPNTAVISNYHSWSNAISVNNGLVEAIVIPTIGRIQQFRFLGDSNGVLWEDPTLYGQIPTNTNYNSTNYIGWGGDKAWPAAQNSWSPTWPPGDFDRRTNAGSFTNGIVTMVGSVDSRFGIRATRTVELLFNEPVMRVTTVFERLATPSPSSLLNSNIAVWIDCQASVATGSRCYIPVPSPSIFPNGYTLTGDAFFGPALTNGFINTNGLISFGPDSVSHKLGFDSGTLILVGRFLSLRVDAPRVPGATYTAGGCSTEVYTGAFNTTPYFELELLSPAPQLPVGGKITFVTTYTIFRTTEGTTDAEAQKILPWQY